jgi:NarL family two-component system sensor histidine kinase LiaS
MTSLARKSLYRIIREATGNAIRHGNCSNISVLLVGSNDRIRLAITDNGCGFDPLSLNYGGKSGLGLLNMKELARNMGGSLTIESKTGRGTTVACEIPKGQDRKTAEKEELIV